MKIGKAFKIVLVGYMGSGKTTVGKELAKILSVMFVDLDLEIEKSENKTVSKIFDSKGAIYFRKKEKIVLEEMIRSENSMVLSLGGGTPCYFDTMNLLNDEKEVHTVYLDVSIPILVNRLLPEKGHRPMLDAINSERELSEFIGKHLFERRPFYSKAKQIVKVNNESSEQLARRIVSLLF
ncbi:MAG: shikimate kinase [Rubritalea sp.]|jgi:shikimate kinase